MAAMRFCSECGARLKVRRTSLTRFFSFCPRCLPRFAPIRLVLIATPVLFAAIGFAIGHYTSAREPFYFIGTPVGLSTNSVSRSADANNHHSSPGSETLTQPQLVISPRKADAICGARTKSGQPCKRKVKGGGYCWQHRDGSRQRPPPLAQ